LNFNLGFYATTRNKSSKADILRYMMMNYAHAVVEKLILSVVKIVKIDL